MPEEKSAKIFLLYASAGAGHRSACAAIRQAILDRQPRCDLRMIDVLDYMPRLFSNLYSNGYIMVASKYPMLWYFIYESGVDLSNFNPPGIWYRLFWRAALNPLLKLLVEEMPNQIISAHFLASWAAGHYKHKYNPGCRVSTVVTDYGIHPVWITPNQDFIFVATDQLRAELAPFSGFLGTDRILPVGIPIHPSFGENRNIEGLKVKYGLDPSRRTILILGGMFGSRNIEDILYWLSDYKEPLQLFLVAGKHYPVSERIKEKLVEKDIKYQLYGYIDFMNDLMAISDLAITKAGALTTSECLSQGLPLVIFRPYPGQEVRNCDYFLEQGVAVRVDQLSGLCHKIESIFCEPGKLEKMKTRARVVSRPDVADKIAGILLDL